MPAKFNVVLGNFCELFWAGHKSLRFKGRSYKWQEKILKSYVIDEDENSLLIKALSIDEIKEICGL